MDNENNFSVDTEQLKNETKDTVNQVKDTIKNTDFKEGAVQTKGFLVDMFSRPISTVERVATGEENVLPKAIIIMILYLAASFVSELIYAFKYGGYRGFGNNISSLIYALIYPVIFVLVPSILVLVLNRKNKKSLITVLSTFVVAAVPNVINEVVSVIDNLVSGLSIVTSPISTMLSALGIVLAYFGMRGLFEEQENEGFIKKYAVIKLLAAFIIGIVARIF